MLKRHSKIKLVIFAIIAILGILLCVCPFAIPSSSEVFNGFIPAINRGIELDGGVETSYTCVLKPNQTTSLDNAIDEAVSKIYDLYSKEGYDEVKVKKLGDDKINLLLSNDALEGDEVYNYLQNSQELSMTLTEASAENPNPEIYVFGQDVSSAKIEYDYDSSSYGIVVNFTKDGKENINNMKDYADETSLTTVYIYLGEINGESKSIASFDISEIKDGMFLTNDSMSSSVYTVQETCHNIIAGSLKVELTSLGTSVVGPTLGENVKLYICIAIAIVVVACLALMIVRYGHLGLLGGLSVAFYAVLFSFIMQAIPFVTLNLTGVIACIVAFIIAVLTNCYIFECIRDEYAIGKKIHLACKGGFKKALWAILDSHIAGALASICIWILAPASVKIFGITMLVGLILSVFASLALTRYFVHLYLPINSTKADKLHLYRDKNVKEVKDEEVEIIPEDQVNSQDMGVDHE